MSGPCSCQTRYIFTAHGTKRPIRVDKVYGRGDPPLVRLASTLAAAQAEREKAWDGEPTRLNRARELPSPVEWFADRSGSLAPYSSAGKLHPCHAWSMQQRPNPPLSELGLARRAESSQQNA